MGGWLRTLMESAPVVYTQRGWEAGMANRKRRLGPTPIHASIRETLGYDASQTDGGELYRPDVARYWVMVQFLKRAREA